VVPSPSRASNESLEADPIMGWSLQEKKQPRTAMETELVSIYFPKTPPEVKWLKVKERRNQTHEALRRSNKKRGRRERVKQFANPSKIWARMISPDRWSTTDGPGGRVSATTHPPKRGFRLVFAALLTQRQASSTQAGLEACSSHHSRAPCHPHSTLSHCHPATLNFSDARSQH
jgi:hypothetical protein